MSIKRSAWMAFALVLCGLSFTAPAQAKMGDELQLLVNATDLRKAPSLTADAVARVTNQDSFVEVERQDAWVFVSLKRTGIQGWLQASTLKTVGETAYVPAGKTSLKDIGFRDGVFFDGLGPDMAQNFFFKVPLDSRITGASFTLLYRAATMISQYSHVGILIDGTPLKQEMIPTDGNIHKLDVVIPPSAFKDVGFVKVQVRTTLLLTKDRCFDARVAGRYLHILPDSTLNLTYAPVSRSVRDAWRMLPGEVTISLPAGKLKPEEFSSALALMELLALEGKKVTIKRLPTIGNIVLAPKAAIQEALGSGQQVGAPEDNLSLIHFANRDSALAVTEPFDVQPIYLLSDEWNRLGAGQDYRLFKPAYFKTDLALAGKAPEGDYLSYPLSKLGFDTSPRFIVNETNWQTTISPLAIPLGTKPHSLNLNLVAPVSYKTDPTYELYVFLNDVLVRTARLENKGQRQQFTIPLPVKYQQQFNKIRVVVQHDVMSGDCFGVAPHDLIQITPDSELIVKKDKPTPDKFSELALYLAGGFDTYVQDKYLDNPDGALEWLSNVAADFPLLIDHSRLHFLSADDELQPEKPFVALGQFKMGKVDAPVRFDKGRVEIVDANNESYFDINHLPRISIAQIAKAGSNYGLWLRPSDEGGLPPVENRISLSEDDVGFIDSNGVLMTINSKQPSVARVYYPDAKSWFDVLGQYSFWLMAFAWFLVTLLAIYLYRATKRHQSTK